MKKLLRMSHLIIAAIMVAAAGMLAACSNSPVNEITATIDNYAQSVEEATSIEEIQEMDGEFAKKMNEYVKSDYKLTSADREALMGSIVKLSNAINGSFERLTGQPTGIDLSQREMAFKAELEKCQTVGDFINMGL